MLFSTFSYVLEAMTAGHPSIPVEIVPGVSSVMAAAASSRVPLATHGQRVAILPAVYGIDDLSEAIASYDTIVLMKVNRELLKSLDNLKSLGLADASPFLKILKGVQEEEAVGQRQVFPYLLGYLLVGIGLFGLFGRSHDGKPQWDRCELGVYDLDGR